MARVEAHRACERFGRVDCDALATLVSDLSFGSLEQSRRDTASLPIWNDGHPSQMTFFTACRTQATVPTTFPSDTATNTHISRSRCCTDLGFRTLIRKRRRRVAVRVGSKSSR